MYEILKDTLYYLDENPGEIDTMTRDAYVYYEKLHREREQEVER